MSPGRRDTVFFEGFLRCKGVVIAAPRMMLQVNQRGSMEFRGTGDHARFKLSVLVSRM